jgi:hypothetical protein
VKRRDKQAEEKRKARNTTKATLFIHSINTFGKERERKIRPRVKSIKEKRRFRVINQPLRNASSRIKMVDWSIDGRVDRA